MSVSDTLAHSDLVYNLVSKPYMFDFANRYGARVKGPFAMTDAVWEEFVTSLPDTALNYESRMEKGLQELRNAAAREGLMNDETRARFDALGKALKRDSRTELTEARAELERFLVPMLAERYGFEQARYAAEVERDPSVRAAVRILLDPTEYRRLLSAPAMPGKKKK